MAFESLIMRALVVGVLVGSPRWRHIRPKTAPANMSHPRGREIEKTWAEHEPLAPEFVHLMSLIHDTASGSCVELKKIEGTLLSSRERQVVASVIQLALTKDPLLNAVDTKFEQEKLGLSKSERERVDKALKDVWLDREHRSNKDLLEAVHLLLYARIHGKIATEDCVVAGSGNNHVALLSPERLKDKVWPKKPGYWLYDAQKQRDL